MSSVRFVHLSDSHIGTSPNAAEDEPYLLHGVDTDKHLRAVVNEINSLSLSSAIDFVVHTGDVVSDADKQDATIDSTRRAARILDSLSPPLLVVNGNHDDVVYLSECFGDVTTPTEHSGLDKRNLQGVGKDIKLLDTHKASRANTVIINDFRLFFLDARPKADSRVDAGVHGGVDAKNEQDPGGWIPQEQLDNMRDVLESSAQDVMVFLHYPPVPVDCLWADQTMLVGNGLDLHKLLVRHADRVRGVFFGHVHHSIQILKDGIAYHGVGAVSCRFPLLPNLNAAEFDTAPAAWYNTVYASPAGTVVKNQFVFV